MTKLNSIFKNVDLESWINNTKDSLPSFVEDEAILAGRNAESEIKNAMIKTFHLIW